MNLPELLERVRAAEGPDRELDAALTERFGAANDHGVPSCAGYVGIAAFTSELNAALALVERVRPGWCKSVVDLRPEPCEAYVWDRGHTGNIQGKAATPALALLAALLSSVIAGDDARSLSTGEG